MSSPVSAESIDWADDRASRADPALTIAARALYSSSSGARVSASAPSRGVLAKSSTSPSRKGRKRFVAGGSQHISSTANIAWKPSCCHRQNSAKENMIFSQCWTQKRKLERKHVRLSKLLIFCSLTSNSSWCIQRTRGGIHDLMHLKRINLLKSASSSWSLEDMLYSLYSLRWTLLISTSCISGVRKPILSTIGWAANRMASFVRRILALFVVQGTMSPSVRS
mmetsp:Transcript_112532/g.211064  ORF Transcript_112532/g.211064 Transcript_112532/m.211064 type:complete len:223 (-) Transcript_112532:1823-2491(-)